MRIPIATYRIQFNSQFPFTAAKEVIKYLAELGISDIYASPIFKARVGSTHGYDIVDPNQLNPELGTQEDFLVLIQELQQHQMGWLQDIVPNHMAYDSQNQYLMDVLEKGTNSIYANYFDIAWSASIGNLFGNNQQPILTPLLGKFYGESLENGEIKLKYDQTGLTVNYYNLSLPVNLESYATFLSQNLKELAKNLGRKHPIFVRLLGILYMVKHIPHDATPTERQDQIDFVKGLLWELYIDHPEIKTFIDDNIHLFNGEVGKAESFNLLDSLLSEQFFRLSFWKVGAEEINYRRFFTINELISLKIEDEKVFKNTHHLIFKLVKQGLFTGLRVDHIDGLYDPRQYLQRLQEKTGNIYLCVEKILQSGEILSDDWQIQGTTGYDFLNYVNGIFCQTKNQDVFTQAYYQNTGWRTPYEQVVTEKKHLMIERNLAGDIDNLTYLLKKIASKHRYGNDFTINGLKRAIAEILSRFPIYRTYINEDGLTAADSPYIQEVIQQAKSHLPLLHHELSFIEKLLLLEHEDSLTPEEQDQRLYFVMRLQQYTGPLMAKGVEDTALYVYNRFISLNEVGGNPDCFGINLDDFHDFNQQRQARWQHTMNTTSTHDTKRGEDIRARLNILSEIPEEWQTQVNKFYELNQQHKTSIRKNIFMPDTNDEYLFYQMLVGAFPFFEHDYNNFCDRFKDYLLKAIREAKVYTAWLRPNSSYENAVINFASKVLEPSENNQFLPEFIPFQTRIAHYGVFNSLAQTLLKITSPGFPDFYQGTELWDFSMVDPDNRRPVDFDIRKSYLQDIKSQITTDILKLIEQLLATKEDGRIKMFLILQALKFRAKYLQVFQQGSYQALAARGKFKDHIIAFMRRHEKNNIITIAPRFLTDLIQPGEYPLGTKVWGDTCIDLPLDTTVNWIDGITGKMVKVDRSLCVGEALKYFPVSLLGS